MQIPSDSIDHVAAFPLTNAQSVIYRGQQLAPQAPLYNMAVALRIKGPLDPILFREAFQSVLDRCDAMRLVFCEDSGIPSQRVLPGMTYEVPLEDVAPEESDSELYRRVTELAREPFDLTRRLFDSRLLRISEHEHIWFLNQHHLIADATAETQVARHVSETYLRLQTGMAPVRQPALPRFADHVRWETSPARHDERILHRAHWRTREDSQFPPPRLYGKPPRASSSRTVRLSRLLPEARREALARMMNHPEFEAFTEELALFNILATALYAWMFRVSGQQELPLGTLSRGRSTPTARETPGNFIELFPVALEVAPEDSFLSLHAKAREEAMRYLRNAYPGSGTTGSLRSFNVILNIITAGFDDFAGMPTSAEWIHCDHCDPGHLLRLQVEDFDDSGEWIFHFDFNEETFSEEQRESAVEHFFRLLDALFEDPTQPLASIDLLGSSEREFLLDEFNRSEFAAPAAASIVELISDSVARAPDHPALAQGSQSLTYDDLARQSDAVAGSLRDRGVLRGDLVGLLLPRSADAVVALLGILKAGAAFLPLDPNLSTERIRFILEDAGARAVLTNSSETGFGPPALTIEDALRGEARALDLPGADDTAYVLYTSGSTGKPKGVVIQHRSLLNYASWAAHRYCRGNATSMPLFTPLIFDLTLTSLFVPLLTGGEIVVYPQADSAGDFALLDVLSEDRVDLIKLTPSHLSMLRGKSYPHSRVKGLILGGEDLKRDLAQASKESFGNPVTIYNEYGPTEATVGCMIHAYDPAKDEGPSVPIGVPAGDSRIYLLDSALNPVPRGVTGEIFIGGSGLAREYLARPELTARHFIRNPFRPGERLYRTGDLARMNERGLLEYLGRCDDQVKVRGVRMELGEIEAALSAHPDVAEVAVKLIVPQVEETTVLHHCTRCGLPSNYPGASFDPAGVCHLCNSFASYQAKAADYFRSMDDLRALFSHARTANTGRYDCMMLLSGGKDSTYALCRLVDLGLRVFAFTLDNGYLSAQAKGNISRVVESLGVDHVFATTPAMNEIFADSLRRFSNVCNGCFKTVYTLALKRAQELGIPYIVTGLSRGQFFETRLTEELFAHNAPESIDQIILDARKAYHRADDAVNRLLDGSCFAGDEIFEQIQFIDFYRYCPDSLEEMLAYLDERVPWIRPTDTGRSTNCLINDAGIYVHKRERGFHNYAFPYSWDVRVGHKEREAALEELDDEIDREAVTRMLDEVGYHPGGQDEAEPRLVAYFVSARQLGGEELRSHLGGLLPQAAIPAQFVQLDRMPLTTNGKLNRDALPDPGPLSPSRERDLAEPRNENERALAGIWTRVLQLDEIGIHDNFFSLGGDSILAIRICSRALEAGIQVEPNQLFQHQTIAELAAVAGPPDQAVAAGEPRSRTEPPPALESLDSQTLDRLANALKKLD